MKRRCYNPKSCEYHRYGARGVSVCQRWLDSFENFLADMGECPPGLTLDRFPDKNGNYRPGNVRWATPAEQTQNRDITKLDPGKVIAIRARRAEGEEYKSIAADFGISESQASNVANGVYWSNVS